MLPLTRQECQALCILAAVIFCGVMIEFAGKKMPSWQPAFQLLEGSALIVKADINTATPEELAQIPGIGAVSAQRICDYRQALGRFRSLEELQGVRGVGPATLQRIAPYLKVDDY